MENQEKKCEILSIDAWRDLNGGWYWNSWHKRGEMSLSILEGMDKPNGKIDVVKFLAYLRSNHSLSIPAGHCEVVDDGYNYVIQLRDTKEPLYAVEYGTHN